MKKSIFIFDLLTRFLWTDTGGEIFAQKQGQEKIDSLLTVLKVAKDDTNKVHTLNNIADISWKMGEFEEAKQYAYDAIALARLNKFKSGEARAYQICGVINMKNGDYAGALVNFFSALKIHEGIKNKKGIANAYNNIGVIYREQGNYPKAINYFNASLKILIEINDKTGIGAAYSNIGIIYNRQGNYPEALKNQFASIKIREEIGDEQGVAYCYNSIGNIYENQNDFGEALKNHFISLKTSEKIEDKNGIADSYSNIGNIYFKQAAYADALKNHSASLKIREDIGLKGGMAISYSNIGNVYAALSNFPEALKNYSAALKIDVEIGDEEGIAIDYINIGETNLDMEKFYVARKYLDKGLLVAKKTGTKENIKEGYLHLASLDSATSNWKDAFFHSRSYFAYRDSLINEETIKKTVQIQMNYDFDKKVALARAEQEKKDALALKELQRQKLVRNGFVGGFAVVLLFAGVFFTQRNKIKKGKKRSDELLLNILPSEVAEELKQKGSAEAKQYDDVTVMFTDFKNFTQISENLSPSELVAEIHSCFKAFDNIMDKYHIEKIKTIGDCYMAAGGLPVPNKTHAADVVKAALEIQQFMEGHFKSSPLGKFGGARIGIHTGPVVAGIVGVKKFAYDIWGDTVNIASRMESSSEAGKVNISGATYELVKDKFYCQHRGKIEAKNKGMIDMYFAENNME